jgi:hypothetical protein
MLLCMGCRGQMGGLDSASTDTAATFGTPWDRVEFDPFADALVSFVAGEAAGFGQDDLPDVVLGPPRGRGASAGSLDVVSLGRGGELVLELTDQLLVDGPGADLIIFENAFVGFVEPGEVAVSEDGVSWVAWPCATEAPFQGCAGLNSVHANPVQNELDPTDPAVAGGDLFDLQALDGGAQLVVRFVRLRDIGQGEYLGETGGFDLDAMAVVHAD